LFDTLKDAMLDPVMKHEVNQLLKQKVKMNESDKGPKIVAINKFIEENLKYYKQYIADKEDDRKAEWDTLNEIFIKYLI
jgi:predicted nucleotidyltransferase